MTDEQDAFEKVFNIYWDLSENGYCAFKDESCFEHVLEELREDGASLCDMLNSMRYEISGIDSTCEYKNQDILKYMFMALNKCGCGKQCNAYEMQFDCEKTVLTCDNTDGQECKYHAKYK